MRRCILVLLAGLWTVGVWADARKTAPWDGSVWRYNYYGDCTFSQYVDTKACSNSTFFVDLRLQKWPKRGSEGGFFMYGWGFVARSEPVLAKAGRYAFKVEAPFDRMSSAICKIAVNGMFVDEREGGVLELPAGKALVEVFGRHGREDNSMSARFTVLWKEPGDADFKTFVPTAASDAAMAKKAVAWDHEFIYEDGFDRIVKHRSWTFVAPEDGLYELDYHAPSSPYDLKIRQDSKPLLNWRPNCSNEARRVLGGGFTGREREDRRLYPADFFGRLGVKTYLTKGEHVFDIMIHWRGNAKYFADQMAMGSGRSRFGGAVRFGISRLDGRNPKSDVGFFLKRDTMILEKGETMEVFGVAGAADAGSYTMEVRHTRGKKPIWTETKKLGREPVRFAFTPTEERGYEYRFLDAEGRSVDGPWTFCMCDPTPVARPKMTPGQDLVTKGVTVDVCPCTEGEGGAHDFRDNGTSTLVDSPCGTYRLVGPEQLTIQNRRLVKGKDGERWEFVDTKDKDALKSGLIRRTGRMDWFAYTLHPKNPRKAHILRCHAPNDMERVDAVMVIDPRTMDSRGGLLLTGQGRAASAKPTLDLVVWPNSTDLYVVCMHSHKYHGSPANRRSAFLSFELIEMPDDLPLLPEAAGGWDPHRGFGWTGEQGDLWVHERTMPPLFDDDDETSMAKAGSDHLHRRWDDFIVTYERFMRFSAWRGDSELSVPVLTYGMLFADGEAVWEVGGGGDAYHAGPLDDRADRFHRDLFRLMLMKANKYGVKLIADFSRGTNQEQARFWAARQGTPDATNGVYFTEAGGKVFAPIGPMLVNPTCPLVRRQLVRFCEEFGERYGRYRAFGGIRFRFWDGCTAGFEPYFYQRHVGYDDFIVRQFSAETGLRFDDVGTDVAKFNARRDLLLSQKYRDRWFAWRTKVCKSLIEEMLAAMRKGAPEARFIGPETPPPGWKEPTPEELALERQGAIKLRKFFWKPSSGLDPEAFRGHRELGFTEGFLKQHYPGCEMCGLDSFCFDKVNRRPAPYTNQSPERVRSQIPGFCCNGTYLEQPYQLAKAAKELAANRLMTFWTSPEWDLPPGDESLRAFVQRWRAIPDVPYVRAALPGGDFANAAVWSGKDRDGKLVVWMVNATEYDQEIEVELKSRAWRIVNRVDGEALRLRKTLSRKLPPFMLEVWTVEGDNAVVGAKLAVSDDEKRYVDGLFANILAMEPYAKGAVERVTPIYGFANSDLSDPCAPDRLYTYDSLVGPMKRAKQAGDYVTLGVLVRQFNRERQWWFEAFGWPEGMKCNRKVGGMFGLDHWAKIAEGKKSSIFANPDEVKMTSLMYDTSERYAVSEPGKPVVLKNGLNAGEYRLELTALFGGKDYGSIRVETNGVLCATIPCGPGKETREETRLVPFALAHAIDANAPVTLALVPEPGKRIAVRRLERIMLEPEPVTEFLVAKAKGRAANDPQLKWQKVTLKPGCRLADLAPIAGPDTLPVEDRELYVKFVVAVPKFFGVQGFRLGRNQSMQLVGDGVAFSENAKWETPSLWWRGGASTRSVFRPDGKNKGRFTHVIRLRPEPEGPYTFGYGYFAGSKFKYTAD